MPAMQITLLVLLLSSALYAVIFHRKQRAKHALRYPPGPTATYPFLGNVFDVPTSFQWITYAQWSKLYGDLIHLTVLGQHVVIINSEKVANELLDKRSKIYSDRPVMPIMEMSGWDIHTGMKRYGDEWRRDRRIYQEKFRDQAASSLHVLQQAKSRTLLHRLLQTPKDFVSHFELYPASLILYLVYGYDVSSRDDLLVKQTFESIKMFSGAVLPAANIVNIFPFTSRLPGWIPGFRKLHTLCKQCRELLRAVQDLPFNSVKQHMAQGTAVQSWVSELLESNELQETDAIPEEVIKGMGASLFSAAMETTSAFLSTFVLAMVLHPEAQRKAHAEIDEVVGSKRLPTHNDRSSLPYVEALVRELFRWNGPSPLGVPHSTTEDDIYEGYFIPKGSTVFSNQWAMCHDQNVYPDPDKFKPERFLTPDGQVVDQHPPVFGFGRRICAARSMAEASTWIAIVSILSTFRMSQMKDEFGNDVEVHGRYHDGIVTAPLPFECSITPRSELAKQLILDSPALELDSNPMYY